MENLKLLQFKNEILNKDIAVIGYGISHKPLVKFLLSLGANVSVFDKCGEEEILNDIESLSNKNVEFFLGADYLSKLNIKDFYLIFKTPGIRKDTTEIEIAVKNGATLTNEMEVFFKLCPAPIYAITGSDGKTTTTTLISEFLTAAGFKCWKGGNIGTPLLDKIDEIGENDKVVVELSSFQLDAMNIAPNVAVITNLSPNHLDWHTDYDEYVSSKTNIFGDLFLHSTANVPKKIVLNYDNVDSRNVGVQVSSSHAALSNISDLIWFSKGNTLHSCISIIDDYIVLKNGSDIKRLLKVDSIRLPGAHNVENFMTAIAATFDVIKPGTFEKVANEFTGVEHRLEFVREINGVRFYNDSIASSPKRTIAGLKSFDKKVILLAGGKDKGIPYDEIGEPILTYVKILILIGATSEKIFDAVKQASERLGVSMPQVFRCENYEQLCRKALESAEIGDVVLLSPASTSFDMFKNFEQRGHTFKSIVNSLNS